MAVGTDHQLPLNAPSVSVGTFTILPPTRALTNHFQPFVSSVGIAWTAYLSLSNAAEEDIARSAPQSPNIRLL